MKVKIDYYIDDKPYIMRIILEKDKSNVTYKMKLRPLTNHLSKPQPPRYLLKMSNFSLNDPVSNENIIPQKIQVVSKDTENDKLTFGLGICR